MNPVLKMIADLVRMRDETNDRVVAIQEEARALARVAATCEATIAQLRRLDPQPHPPAQPVSQ